uniref:Uncharacterized protein n=1 Tax=Triticum urartu TaxID=4572 RepID=A0A8R7QT64_TRIUA
MEHPPGSHLLVQNLALRPSPTCTIVAELNKAITSFSLSSGSVLHGLSSSSHVKQGQRQRRA